MEKAESESSELVGHIHVLVADRHMDNDVIVAVDDAAYEQDACDNDAMWVVADDNDRDDDMEGMDDEEYEDDDTVNTKEMVSHEVGEVDMHGGTKGGSEVGGA